MVPSLRIELKFAVPETAVLSVAPQGHNTLKECVQNHL